MDVFIAYYEKEGAERLPQSVNIISPVYSAIFSVYFFALI